MRADEGRAVLRRPGHAAARGLARRPEADGPDRLPADPAGTSCATTPTSGTRDFILCLGYRADAIKDYFLHYDEALSNDFVLSERRPRRRAAQQRHRRLADHLRRHRARREHRRAAAGACAAPRARGDVPGQLRRHPHRRAARPTSIERFRASGATVGFARRAPSRTRSTWSRSDDDGLVSGVAHVDASRASGSTAASSSCAGDLRLHRAAARSSSTSRSQRLIASGRAARATATTASGRRMDTLKDKQPLEDSTRRRAAPWAVWQLARSAAVTTRCTPRCAAMRPTDRGSRRRPAAAVLVPRRPRGRHRDRLRRHAAATRRGAARTRGSLGRPSAATAERADEARRSAAGFLGRRRGAARSSSSFRDGFLPYEGARGEGVLRGAEARAPTRPDLHAPPRRPAPGPPPRLRADLEHVPRPPDPRVRDPEVRRRLDAANVFAPPVRAGRTAEDRAAHRPLRVAARPSAGSRRTSSRARCACAAWRRTRRAAWPRPSPAGRRCWR